MPPPPTYAPTVPPPPSSAPKVPSAATRTWKLVSGVSISAIGIYLLVEGAQGNEEAMRRAKTSWSNALAGTLGVEFTSSAATAVAKLNSTMLKIEHALPSGGGAINFEAAKVNTKDLASFHEPPKREPGQPPKLPPAARSSTGPPAIPTDKHPRRRRARARNQRRMRRPAEAM
ncbi:hypothetical protein [Sinosporangium siamense]|uniref:hypothetical protein n=1 Tax=Sinosporangium siamense TaxID=1367973 RepID=UPI001EF3713C|nr:hypothetical protein [Sinosporangium siamense]